jgi:hypothetical protein
MVQHRGDLLPPLGTSISTAPTTDTQCAEGED